MAPSSVDSLVGTLPWDTFPAEHELPTVDHPETREPTPYIDSKIHSKVERILFEFFHEVRALRPQPSWVPEQSLVLVAQICLLLHLKQLRHLLPIFLQHKIRDNDLPLSFQKLTAILHDESTSRVFHESQYMATLRDIHFGWQKYLEHELIPIKTIRRLGTGSFAQVDRVELVLQKREVAHKLFTRNPKKEQKSVESIDAEIKSLRKLGSHRHIVSYLGAYETQHHFGLLLSPVAECDLAKFLEHSVEMSREWGFQRDAILYRAFGCLISALTHMHSLHNIKPQNILIERRGHLETTFLFTDFGIAVDLETMTETFTTGSNVRGTQRYFAPEVAYHGQRGRRSDVYSLGCVFLEIATVLAGSTPKELDEHLGGDAIFYESYDEIETWITRLVEAENPYILLIAEHIRRMLRRVATARPQAQAVLSDLGDKSVDDPRFPNEHLFCPSCWLAEDGESTLAGATDLDFEDSDYEDGDRITPRSKIPTPTDDAVKIFDYAASGMAMPNLTYMQQSQTYIEVAKIPQLRKGNALSVVNVYISFVSCLKGYNLFAHISGLWAHRHLRQRLDLEMLRLLNWGTVVQLVNGGPLQPATLESSEAIQIALVNNFNRQLQVFQRILNKHPLDANLLHTRSASHIKSDRHSEIPETAVQALTSLFASIITHTQETSSSTVDREAMSSDVANWALDDLELCNDELSKLLDRGTAVLLSENDAETYLALLQLSSSLEDTGALLRAIESSKNNDPQSLAKRQSLIQIAHFKAHFLGVQELGLTKSRDAMQRALGGYNWQFENATDLLIDMKDIVHFADEVEYLDTEILSGLWRHNGTKRLIWIEWKELEPALGFAFEKEMERVKDLTALLSYSDKPAEFCGPICVGYVPDEEMGRVGLVYEVPDHVSAQYAFEPMSLSAVLNSNTDLSKQARRQLALKLSNSVLHLHSVDWLHKSFSGYSIMFFRDNSGSPNLGFPIISGFGLSRPATRDDMTERPSDNPEADVYRHPVVQREANRGGFKKIHDIYSLGVVLFELAYCKPVTRVLGIDMTRARPRDIVRVRERLLSEAPFLDGVADAMGLDYKNVVEACLTGVEGLGLEADADERDRSAAAMLLAGFVSTVVRKLKYLVKNEQE